MRIYEQRTLSVCALTEVRYDRCDRGCVKTDEGIESALADALAFGSVATFTADWGYESERDGERWHTVRLRSPFPCRTLSVPATRSMSRSSRASASATRSPERHRTAISARLRTPLGAVLEHAPARFAAGVGVKQSFRCDRRAVRPGCLRAARGARRCCCGRSGRGSGGGR